MSLVGIGEVASLAEVIVRRAWPPDVGPEQLAAAQAQVEQIITDRDRNLLETQRSILVAELEQGDDYTKRARPTVVYMGLMFIFLIYVLFPMAAFYGDKPVPDLQLPTEFWWAWGSVVSVWAIGRSFEKRGVQNNLMKAITG